jgi:hypothetical protein
VPLVNVTAPHGNIELQEASYIVWSTALTPGFRERFLVSGVPCLLLAPVGLMLRDRSNFTDCLKWALTLFS